MIFFRFLTDVQRVLLVGPLLQDGSRELVDDVVLGGGLDLLGGRDSNGVSGLSGCEKTGGGFGVGQGLGRSLLQLLQLLGRHGGPDLLQRGVLDPGCIAAAESLREDVADDVPLDDSNDSADNHGSEDGTQDDGGDPVVGVLERQTSHH